MPEPMIQKPISFVTPESIQTVQATHLVCQPLPGRYVLSFFECLPPFVVGATDTEKQREWEKIQSIPATCVARLVVADVDMAGFIQCLQQQQAAVKQQQGLQFKAFA